MTPVRTCIGCRQSLSVDKLRRIVLNGDQIQFSHTSNGRGAWICNDAKCLKNGLNRRVLQRALKSSLADCVLHDTLRRCLAESTD